MKGHFSEGSNTYFHSRIPKPLPLGAFISADSLYNLYFCSHGLSYPISGLVKNFFSADYDTNHPVVVSSMSVVSISENASTISTKVLAILCNSKALLPL